MKLLLVYKDYYPVVGGIENHIRQICQGLQDYPDIEPTVLVTSRTAHTTQEIIDGVNVIKTSRLANISSAPISLTLFTWMRRLEADLVHLHFPYPIGEMAYLAAGRGRPMVITYHSDIVRQKYLLQLYKPFLHQVLDRARQITVSNPNYIDSSPYLEPRKDRCTVIPFGIDLSKYTLTPEVQTQAAAVKERYHGAPLVLFVGLLRYYKGVSYLIEAMQQVEGQLLVVGQGPEEANLRALTQQLGLENKVAFLGRVDDPTLLALYHACDVFVLPSIHRSESWGFVQIEAMACGKPVICTELGTGTSFVNLNEVTGLVTPPRDASALAAALNRLLSDPELRRRLGQAGRERTAREFDYRVMTQRLVQFYHDALK